MKDENTLYWIWLSERCGVASKAFGRLVTRYDDPFELYRMDEDEIEHLEGVEAKLKSRLCDKSLESAYSILRYCKANGVQIVAYTDSLYPMRLRSIEDPPVLLYVLGRLPDMNRRVCVGMVGTRKMSEYGRQSAYKISYELASAGAVIVSGMALGIDGVAACGALNGGGETVAVLGCGISIVYPKEHEKLMKAIRGSGAVVTEYAPNEPPNGYHFPIRNRIISGLCQGVLIVEGSSGSGALITAKSAIGQGRELFALPGKINESNSDGPNELIQNGARVVLCADDIIRHYDFLYHDVLNYKGLKRAKLKPIDELGALASLGVSARTVDFSSARKKDGAEMPRKAPEQSEAARRFEPTEQPKQQKEPTAEKTVKPDESESLLASLDERTRRVFEAMPIDRSVSPDALLIEGMGIAETITALTLLELSGLVTSLPGGVYLKK